MSQVHIKVKAQFDSAGGMKDGTITINRETGEVVVRQLRARRAYHSSLRAIANMVCKVGTCIEASADDKEGVQ